MNQHAPVETHFFVPRTPVSILALGDSGEALLLRALLENLGAVVTLHLPGTPEDTLLVLSQGSTAPPYLIISGHGNDTGFILGEFGPEIDTSPLIGGSLSPRIIATRLNLPDTTVVSTACLTGTSDFADAFLSGGVSAYIAPEHYPEGTSSVLFVHLLFYHLLVARTEWFAAWNAAARSFPDCRQFICATIRGIQRVPSNE